MEKSFKILIKEEACQGCGNCVVVCPLNKGSSTGFGPKEALLKIVDGQVEVINPELCDGCGLCVSACPVNAIEIIPLKPTSAERLIEVGKMERIKVEEVERRKLSIEEIPIPKKAETVGKGIDTFMNSLRSVKVRFLLELGKADKVRKEVLKRMKREV